VKDLIFEILEERAKIYNIDISDDYIVMEIFHELACTIIAYNSKYGTVEEKLALAIDSILKDSAKKRMWMSV